MRPPEALAAWKPCEKGNCGIGPYCNNCRALWTWLEDTSNLGVAARWLD